MTTRPLRERWEHDFVAGVLRDGARRYMMIRPAAIMGVFRRLDAAPRAAALAAFADSIEEQGGDSARAYLGMGGTRETLPDVIAATAPDLGWGRWTFARRAGGLDLRVENSPFAEGFGTSLAPVCTPIVGMLRAVGAIVFDGPVVASEVACAAMGAGACSFRVAPRENAA